ncbi:MAG: sugar phosphate nucleotidyltransferase, partial [Bacteroidota bacterium]
MKAVTMAGGFGTRLRPLTCNLPKPMVPMMNKPMMQHLLELLRSHHIHDVVATVFFHPEIITRYFDDGSGFRMRIQYVRSDADYGTAGGVRNAAALLSERFIIISSDILTDIDLTKAIRFHEERKAQATIVLSHSKDPLQYGIVITRDDGSVSRFLEKPSWGEVFSNTVNTGIYILEPEILQLVPHREEFDFSKDLFPLMIERGMALYGYIADGYWRDIGNLNEYQEAHFDCLEGRVKIDWRSQDGGSVSVGKDTVLKTQKENLRGAILIGKNCVVEENVKIYNSVIGDHSVIGRGSVVRNSVIWNDVSVGILAEISSSIVATKCSIAERSTIGENVFIGHTCIIGREARLAPNIKLWPGKVVEDGAVLTRSLVSEDKWLSKNGTILHLDKIKRILTNPFYYGMMKFCNELYEGNHKPIINKKLFGKVQKVVLA